MKQTVICGDCRKELKNIPDKSIDVVMTSPPFSINIPYNTYKDNLELEEWLKLLFDVSIEINRVLKDDGSYFINLGGACKKWHWPLLAITPLIDSGFQLQNHIVWVKSITVNNETTGHFKPVNTSQKYLNKLHESIYHLTKNDADLDRLAIGVPFKHKYNANRWSNNKDLRCRGNVWFVPYKTVHKRKSHPAAFPIEIPEYAIKLAGIKENMTVLDPFLGSGTTLLACKKLNINGIGIELDKEYCELAIHQLAEFIPD